MTNDSPFSNRLGNALAVVVFLCLAAMIIATTVLVVRLALGWCG